MAATLFSTATAEEQWRDVTGPWLRERALTAWKDARPTVILTPSRAESFYLRSRLVGEGVPHLGLRFWTPSDARQFLLRQLLPEAGPAAQAELRLLARASAEKLTAKDSSDGASIVSVARDPAAFLRAYDLLLGAGWDPAKEGAVYGLGLAREFQRALARNGIATQAGLHRELRRLALERRPELVAGLLVAGFNATHWPLWDLLQAFVACSGDATVALQNPRRFAGPVDQLWYGSWEQFAESASNPPPVASTAEVPTPFADLVDAYERGAVPEKEIGEGLTFLATPDLASQTRAVVLQALDYLRREDCTRLGIVFPSANALALGVAEELRRLGLPHDDGTGAWMPGDFEHRHWQAWLALQEEPGAQNLIAWVRACEADGVPSGLDVSVSGRELGVRVEAALGETLVDDLGFLARHLEQDRRFRESPVVAEFLRTRVALPESGTFAAFLDLTQRSMTQLGWTAPFERLTASPPAWLVRQRHVLSRRSFLEWVRDAAASQMRVRGADGNHFYGKIHLVIYAQMTGQAWSHLILTGLNEGVWPRRHEPGAFGSRHELVRLNAQIRELNPYGRREGAQGAGHETVAPRHGHCLLPLEQQELALRDLCAALESTTAAASLAAMTTEAGRGVLPSDFFNFAFQYQTGRILSDADFRAMAEATEAWSRQHDGVFSRGADLDPGEIAPTRIAHAARHDAEAPFGPYEFCFAQPPEQPVQLTCKQWEDAWRHPAAAWLAHVVGAEAWPEGNGSWPGAMGTWVHRWLALALREWRERPRSAAEFPVLVWAAADRDAAAIRAGSREESVTLCPWWGQVWSLARTRALQLGETLAPHLPDHSFLFEFKLPPGLIVALPGSARADFELKGRIDFLRIDEGEMTGDLAHPNLAGCRCWVVDFKTGSARGLTPKNVLEGTGLQAVLYARAAQALGATSTSLSLFAPGSEPKTPVELTGEVDPVLASLDALHRRGVFGMRAQAASDYGYAPEYPIATQFVPSYILAAKWERTHGAEAEDES